MPAELSWYDDSESILVCRFTGEFGIENYAVMEGQLPMMVRDGVGRVDVILHLGGGAGLPPLRGIFQEIGIIINVMPDNFGVFVGVGDGFLLGNPLSVWMGHQVVKRYYSNGKVHVAASIPVAVQRIHQLRA